MSYHGDIRLGETIDIKFTTRQISGAPFTLAGSPVISAYVGNGTTEITAGITLTVDFDARTGLNNVRVVATSGNGFATATNVSLVITTGTVNSVSVVGEEIGSFSIENRSAVMPTVAARTLDVSAGGEAGIDWANIGSPTTAVNLSATNIDVDQVTASVSGAVGSVTGGVTVTTNNDKTGYGLSGAAVQAIWDALTSALTTAGSIGKLLVDNINATISSRLASASYTAPPDVNAIADQVWDEAIAGHAGAGSTGAALSAAGSAGDPWATALPGAYGAGTAGKIVGDNINATISSRLATAGYTAPLDAAGTRAAVGLASASLDTQLDAVPTAIENADALLDRNMATGTDSGSPTVRTPRQALRFLRNRWDVAAGSLTVKKEDDTTTSWTGTVSSDAAALPIIGNDPAS